MPTSRPEGWRGVGMCGRYTLNSTPAELVTRFGLEEGDGQAAYSESLHNVLERFRPLLQDETVHQPSFLVGDIFLGRDP